MKPKIDTIVQFSGLESGRYEYNYTLDNSFFERFENEELREGEVNFAVVLEKRERLLMFDFAFHGVVKTICDRCLGELEVPVSGEETLCVKFSDTETSDKEDVVILPEGEHQIDLAQWMYEYVAVAMPIQTLHPDDANGAPTCDPEMLHYLTDEEASNEERSNDPDPRWAALEALREPASPNNEKQNK